MVQKNFLKFECHVDHFNLLRWHTGKKTPNLRVWDGIPAPPRRSASAGYRRIRQPGAAQLLRLNVVRRACLGLRTDEDERAISHDSNSNLAHLGWESSHSTRLYCCCTAAHPMVGFFCADSSTLHTLPAAFFLFYIKKNQNFKNTWPFQKTAKMDPCRPGRGRHAPLVKKFLQTDPWAAQRGDSAAGGPVAPPTGDRGACRPPLGRPLGQPTGAAGGPVAPPPAGDRGMPLYIRPPPPFPPHLSPKIPPKIQKKERDEEKESGETLPDCALVICR